MSASSIAALGLEASDQLLVVTGRLHVDRDSAYTENGRPLPNAFTGLERENVDYVLSAVLFFSFTGTEASGVRYRTYITAPTRLTFPGHEHTRLAPLADALTGNSLSIQLREASASHTRPRCYTMQLALNSTANGTWIDFDVQPSTVYAETDANGFPVLAPHSLNYLLTNRVYLERYLQDTGDVFQINGSLAALGEMYLRMP